MIKVTIRHRFNPKETHEFECTAVEEVFGMYCLLDENGMPLNSKRDGSQTASFHSHSYRINRIEVA